MFSTGITANPSRDVALQLLIAAVTGYGTRTLILVKTPFVAAPNTLFADITEADFTGYAREVAVAFGSPYLDSLGRWHSTGPAIQYEMTDAVTPNTIYGWALCNAAVNAIVACATFESPIALSIASQGFTLESDIMFGA